MPTPDLKKVDIYPLFTDHGFSGFIAIWTYCGSTREIKRDRIDAINPLDASFHNYIVGLPHETTVQCHFVSID